MINKEFKPNLAHSAYLIRHALLKSVSQYADFFGGKLLDFGCGSKPYQSLFKSVNSYTGIDFNGLGHCHKKEQIEHFYDGNSLPFKNGEFDSVFSSEVFEHVFNLEQILKEINRVTKVQGYIFITCPFAICEHEQPNDFARYSSFGLTSLLQRNGFKVIMFDKAGNAFTTIAQLYISHVQKSIVKIFGKIPVVRTVLRYAIITPLNVLALIGSALSVNDSTLYMNNIVIATKITNL
jgi:ubiquinone/menaquinone biosynthesis C-methylase UbiE